MKTDDPSYVLRIEQGQRARRSGASSGRRSARLRIAGRLHDAGAAALRQRPRDRHHRRRRRHRPRSGHRQGAVARRRPESRPTTAPIASSRRRSCFGEHRSSRRRASGRCWRSRPAAAATSTTSHMLWSFDNGPDVPTPVTDGTYLYVVNDRGIMWCLDAKTGKRGLRPAAPAPGHLQRLARAGRRQDLRHQRGRRDDGRAGGPEVRGARRERPRRLHAQLAGHLGRADLHPHHGRAVGNRKAHHEELTTNDTKARKQETRRVQQHEAAGHDHRGRALVVTRHEFDFDELEGSSRSTFSGCFRFLTRVARERIGAVAVARKTSRRSSPDDRCERPVSVLSVLMLTSSRSASSSWPAATTWR